MLGVEFWYNWSQWCNKNRQWHPYRLLSIDYPYCMVKRITIIVTASCKRPLVWRKEERAKNREKTQRVKTHREQRAKTSRSRGVKHCKAAKVKTKRRKHWAPFVVRKSPYLSTNGILVRQFCYWIILVCMYALVLTSLIRFFFWKFYYTSSTIKSLCYYFPKQNNK